MQKCEEITAFMSDYQPLFFLFKTNEKTQQHINIHIYSICGSVTQSSFFYTTPIWSSWERWWKTKDTAASQDAFSTWSLRPFLSEQWFQWERSLLQSASLSGCLISLPFTQRRQRNLIQEEKERLIKGVPYIMIHSVRLFFYHKLTREKTWSWAKKFVSAEQLNFSRVKNLAAMNTVSALCCYSFTPSREAFSTYRGILLMWINWLLTGCPQEAEILWSTVQVKQLHWLFTV